MNTLPVDPSLLVQQATQSDVIQRKLDMDALRKRLGDTATKEEKLRESCEGFEAIFLQKMWEQMRKNVPKEGYLHSKDEEMYQSLFDIELCKKMAGAGGIGLADMLYEQLSQQLDSSGRTTSPGAYRNPLDIAPAGLVTASKGQPANTPASAPEDKKMTAEQLYTPLPGQDGQEEPPAAPPEDLIAGALHELRAELGLAPREAGAAARQWAEARAAATGQPLEFSRQIAADPAQNTPDKPAPEAEKNAAAGTASPARAGEAHGRMEHIAQGAAPATPSSGAAAPPLKEDAVQEAARPQADSRRLFGRRKKGSKTENTAAAKEKIPPAQQRGMAPQDTLWPLGGSGGAVSSHFGWEDDKGSGKRHWNSGIRIETPPQSPVRAVLDGTVVYAGQREGYGHTIVLEHKDGFRSYYSNLERNSVRVGDRVKHGAEFAQTAAQPPSSANGENSASLYFELKRGEMALNPENAIQRGV